MRGSLSGNHIALSVSPGARRLVIGEGIETVLSVRLALAERKPAEWKAGTLFWSSISLGNLGGRADGTVIHPTDIRIDARGAKRRVKVPGPVPLDDPAKPALMPPDGIDEIILLGDGDSDRFSTELVLQRAAARWAQPGRVVRAAWAPEGRDFNDLMREGLN